MKMIADNGLPLKIQAQFTDDDYWNRKYDDSDEMECVNVAGWLIRINGKKYPRQLGEDDIDWSYRYTCENNESGKQIAIQRALTEAGLRVADKQMAKNMFGNIKEDGETDDSDNDNDDPTQQEIQLKAQKQGK